MSAILACPRFCPLYRYRYIYKSDVSKCFYQTHNWLILNIKYKMFQFFLRRGSQSTRNFLIANRKFFAVGAVSLLAVDRSQLFQPTLCHAQFQTSPQPVVRHIPDKIVTERSIQSLIDSVKKYIRYLRRILTYFLYGAPLVGLVPISYYYGDKFPRLEAATWSYLIWAIQRLGPCFVKLAQWMSTRPDLFPPNLVEKLVRLQDDVNVTHSLEIVDRTITEAFGQGWQSKLTLEEKPIGTGSVAQVFRGSMLVEGKPTKVAVKMVHPQVETQMIIDMELLTSFADYLDSYPSLEILSIGETLRQFAEAMHMQLDLRVEARNLLKFNKNFALDKWAEFPQPVSGYITKNVLVETLMDGVPISQYMDKTANIPVKLQLKLSDLGSRLAIKMIFFDNFIHGDLHPGTVIILKHFFK